MQYSQEHLKTMVYAEFGGQTECIMGNWKIENGPLDSTLDGVNTYFYIVWVDIVTSSLVFRKTICYQHRCLVATAEFIFKEQIWSCF